MKTQNLKLIFKKSSITELNAKVLQEINGGTGSDFPITSCICPKIFKTLTISQ